MGIILGISGKKQSGKDSVSNYIKNMALKEVYKLKFDFMQLDNGEIVTHNNYDIDNFTKFSPLIENYPFADTLKETCINIFGLTEEQCWGTDDQKNTLTRYKWERLPQSIRDCKKEKRDSVFLSARELMQVFATDIIRNMFGEDIWVNASINKIKRDFGSNKTHIAIITDVRFPSEVQAIMENDGYIIRLKRKSFQDEHESETALDDYNFDEIVNAGRCLIIDNSNCSLQEKNDKCISFVRKNIFSKLK